MPQVTEITDYDLAQSISPSYASQIPKPRNDHKLGYWKKCDDRNCARHHNDYGYIMIGPMRTRYQEIYDFEMGKHAKVLSEAYLQPDPKNPNRPVNDELSSEKPGVSWVPLVRNGGLKEMPIAQMRDLNW